ncbi:MAG TPA: hypothetical protein VH583_09925 [Vicinamibacterales bacterium]|jgi:hypothetical protein
MKSATALVSSFQARSLRLRHRRRVVDRFAEWQKRLPSSTPILVRLVRLLSR